MIAVSTGLASACVEVNYAFPSESVVTERLTSYEIAT
jgi:hypothetical protein